MSEEMERIIERVRKEMKQEFELGFEDGLSAYKKTFNERSSKYVIGFIFALARILESKGKFVLTKET